MAPVEPIPVGAEVTDTGRPAWVVNEIAGVPTAEPAEFVAISSTKYVVPGSSPVNSPVVPVVVLPLTDAVVAVTTVAPVPANPVALGGQFSNAADVSA